MTTSVAGDLAPPLAILLAGAARFRVRPGAIRGARLRLRRRQGEAPFGELGVEPRPGVDLGGKWLGHGSGMRWTGSDLQDGVERRWWDALRRGVGADLEIRSVAFGATAATLAAAPAAEPLDSAALRGLAALLAEVRRPPFAPEGDFRLAVELDRASAPC